MPHLTPTSAIAAPYNPVAMHPSIASTPMYPSIATPVQMVTATPPYIATPIYSLFQASTPLLSTPTGCNTFNQLQPSQEFCPLGPELDMMLQSGSMNMFLQQWQVSSTPQWNFNGLESNPFVTAGLTTFNMTTHPNYLAMATHSGVGLPPFTPAGSPLSRNDLPSLPPAPLTNNNSLSDGFTQHLQLFAYTGPGSTPNHSQPSSIVQNSEDPEGTALGKRKPVPSLCAKRDNMIGNTDKENLLPSLEQGKKSKGKCPAASDTNMSTSGPIRKPK